MAPASSIAAKIARRARRALGAADQALYARGLRSAEELPLPDFLGIGLMKCGTTWLYENLREHPDVFMSANKELRYFSAPPAPLASYAAHFRDADAPLKGEISPPYGTMPIERIRLLHALLPDVRLVLLLRDPVEREWSHVHHRIVKSGRNVEDVPDDEVRRMIEGQSLLRIGGYPGILDRWTSVFPAGRLHVGIYEDIRARPRELLAEVFAHIGARPVEDWSPFPADEVIIPPYLPGMQDRDQGRGVRVSDYRSSDARFPPRYRALLRERHEGELQEMRRRFGERVEHWLEPVRAPA